MKQNQIPSATAILAILIGVLCPLCALAPILLTAGLGSVIALVAPWFAPALLILVGISLVGFFLSYRTHKNPFPLILTVIAGVLMYYGRYMNYSNTLAYSGGGLLILAVGFDWWIRRKNKGCETCNVNCESCKINYAHQKKQ